MLINDKVVTIFLMRSLLRDVAILEDYDIPLYHLILYMSSHGCEI